MPVFLHAAIAIYIDKIFLTLLIQKATYFDKNYIIYIYVYMIQLDLYIFTHIYIYMCVCVCMCEYT